MQRVITQQEMNGRSLLPLCSSVFPLALVAVACHTLADFVGFLILAGCRSLPLSPTPGNRPYGYIGLGDISVLVFFGWLSVMGSWYLQAHTLIPALILPATACGLLATAVLNINNLRDINSDRENGKTRWWCA
ncbi:1,4-dihydroxy-2-naphthoate octaprenyltransferase [Escherichia coli]|nr:1,4-dihydroxy-2-naphthoate octaprenyltransferase [Escherichia coli]